MVVFILCTGMSVLFVFQPLSFLTELMGLLSLESFQVKVISSICN